MKHDEIIKKKAKSLKLLFLDADGVLTDGSITIDSRGEEIKTFNVKDGHGLKMLMAQGVEVVIVSGRRSGALAHRARDLGIVDLFQGIEDKQAVCRAVMKERGLPKEAVAAMGDDLPDLTMFQEVGLSISVADAAKEVRDAADLVTERAGGKGAVREACEWILNGRRDKAVDP